MFWELTRLGCAYISRRERKRSPETVPYWVIGAFAGLRSAELERLEWKDIRFERSLIELGTAKAKTRARRNAQRFLREVCINQLSESLETVPLVGSPRPGNIHPLNTPTAIQLK